jgi:hypothetical protein
MPVPPATLTQWQTTGTKSQQVAAHLAVWAASQRPGTIVPAPDVIIRDLPTITAPVSVHRAIRLLADAGVLRRDEATGHYHVTAPQPGHPGG